MEAFNAMWRMNEVKKGRGYPVWFDTTDEINIYFTQKDKGTTFSDYLTLMRGMIDPNTKEQVATIIANIDIRFIKSAINLKSFKSDGNIIFMSEKGPLASLNENLKAPRIKDFPSLIEKIKEAKRLNKNIVNEDNSIIFFSELPQTEYFIIQVVDRHALIKDALVVRNQSIMILIACIIIALSLAYGVTRSISEPIDKLALAMGGTEENQFPSIFEDTGKDEITQLGLHYNEMLNEIYDLIEELYVTEIKKNDARLNALQMQINPHFIYNTLDFMRWEAMDFTDSENNLSSMINDFSKLLRLSIKKGKDIVSIKEELEHIEAYLKVSNRRHDPPIELVVNNRVDDFTMPKLTLQPLIENAIIHGFEKPKSKKIINIDIIKKGRIIEIIIKDNGKGISELEVKQLNQRLVKDGEDEGSIGLSNVNQRIKLYYGSKYGLVIKKSLEGGVEAIIKLPMREGVI